RASGRRRCAALKADFDRSAAAHVAADVARIEELRLHEPAVRVDDPELAVEAEPRTSPPPLPRSWAGGSRRAVRRRAPRRRLRRGPLELVEQRIEPLVARLPQLPIPLEPRARLGKRRRFDPARAALTVLPDGDEPSPLQHPEVLRDRGLTDQ